VTDNRHSSPRYRALIQLLRTAEDLWNSSRIFFDRWDISPSQFNVLNLLYGTPEGMSQSDLSRLLIMHRSNATGLIDRLERRLLVRRESHPSDRRAYRVVITPAGADLLNQIYPHYFAAADRVWANLPDTAVTQLLDQLQELTAHAAAVAAAEAVTADPDPASIHPERARRGRHSRLPPQPSAAPPASPSDDPLRTSDL
jgi:DNA-binding MarR family transcriptional regulator